MSNGIGMVIIALGMLFNIFGCIGLIRLPDVYNRLQAATKCVTLGTCLVLIGVMVLSESPLCAWKAAICIVFIVITSPTAAHALARGAHHYGVELWDKSVCDKYAQDKGSENREEQE